MKTIALSLSVWRSTSPASETHEQALAMVTEALELWFEDVPVPHHLHRPMITTVDLHLSA